MDGISAAVNYNVNNRNLGRATGHSSMESIDIFPTPLTTTLGTFPVPTGTGEGYEGDGQLSSITYYDQKSVPLPYYQRMLVDFQHQLEAGMFSRFPMLVRKVARVRTKPTSTCRHTKPDGSMVPAWDLQHSTRRGPNNAGRFGDIH